MATRERTIVNGTLRQGSACRSTTPSTVLLVLCVLVSITFAGCRSESSGGLPQGDPDNGGLLLPEGFEAVVVADSVGRARHLTVNDNGDIYVTLRNSEPTAVALRDTTGDGKADVILSFGEFPGDGNFGTAMTIYNDYLYFSTAKVVYRMKLAPGSLLPVGEPEVVLTDDYRNAEHGYEHIAKPVTFDGQGNMYVPFGSPGDVCQKPNRTPGLPGRDPCPELEAHAGVWKFDASRTNQIQDDGVRYATGIRSLTALTWNPVTNELYGVQHGRDNLHRMWPDLYSAWDNAMLPAEEFMEISENSDYGWPYCMYDQLQNRKILNPEYGGDGETIGRCSDFRNPLIGFPGHFAPNDLLFYQGEQFPEHYRKGAFIAFHGSTIRAPYPQAGYFVAFVPFENGKFSEDWEVFANGFSVVDPIVNTNNANHRPTGLAMGPDGSLYISDSVQGKIWRVMYKGDRENFGEEQLAEMRNEKLTANNIRTPHEVNDNLQEAAVAGGEQLYRTYCASCHQGNGKGSPPRYPPLAGTDWVTGDKQRLISVILGGLEGPIVVRGESYNFPMPQHSFLSDEQISEIATYIRQSFGNNASAVTSEEVKAVRDFMNQTVSSR